MIWAKDIKISQSHEDIFTKCSQCLTVTLPVLDSQDISVTAVYRPYRFTDDEYEVNNDCLGEIIR